MNVLWIYGYKWFLWIYGYKWLKWYFMEFQFLFFIFHIFNRNGDFDDNQRNVQCFRLGKKRRSGIGFEEDEIRRRRDFNLKETRFEKEWLEISILKTKVKCFRVGKALNKDRFSRRDTLCTTCSNFCHIGKGDAKGTQWRGYVDLLFS